MPDLQIALVAARRPDLLKKTLQSFDERVFSNFNITNVYVNIDPIFGDEEDLKATKNCIFNYLPDAIIRTPEKPCFGQAVKWLWGALDEGLALHMEDDWVVNEIITPEDILPLLEKGTSAVAPVCKSHYWNKKDKFIRITARKRILFGLFEKKTWPFAMGTTPKFILGEFANAASELMDPNLDPEKQMQENYNKPLFDLIQRNKCVFLPPKDAEYVISDIGREWREERKIVKEVRDGISYWSSTNDMT